MPPLPPQNGMSATAHFQVIHEASAETSSSDTSGWKRIPPFAGPRAMLCWTRKPSNMRMLPSLAAPERDVGNRALPGHPRAERRALFERHVGVEADPALRGPARDVVLDAEA